MSQRYKYQPPVVISCRRLTDNIQRYDAMLSYIAFGFCSDLQQLSDHKFILFIASFIVLSSADLP